MREFEFSIFHQDCWASLISEKYPEVRFRYDRHTHLPKEGCEVEIGYIEAPDGETLKRVLKDFIEEKRISRVDVLAKTELTAKILVMWRGRSSHEMVLSNNMVYIKPTEVIGGYERHAILTPGPNNLLKILKDSDEVGEVRVHKIGRYSEEGKYDLTDKQRQAIKLAINHGYYRWPRGARLEELAAIMGVSRQVFQNHLRKAEAKIFPHLKDESNLLGARA